MLHRYGEFVVRRARLLLVISGVVLVAAAVFGAGAFGKLKNGGFDDPATQSSQAQQLIDQKYGGQSNLILLVTAKSGTVDAPSVAAAYQLRQGGPPVPLPGSISSENKPMSLARATA